MIRAVALLSLVGLLILVLYLPSTRPPQEFLAQLRAEHQAAAQFWGHDAASRMLSRALSMQDNTRQTTPVPSPANATDPSVNGAVAREMSTVNQRLFDNDYFRSIDALLLLASYRLATLLQWLPWLLAFMLAASMDGYFLRLIRAKEFLQHDPEMFALYASGAIVMACASVIALVMPVTLPPLLMPCAPLLVSLLMSRALGSFHRRG